jgi:hypothetical protein
MQKALWSTGVCLLFLLLAGNAFSFSSTYSLEGTTWTGDLTVVQAGGTVSNKTDFSLSFTADDSKFVGGTITDFGGSFSGIKGGLGCYVEITATNLKISAVIVKGHKPRRGTPTPDKMVVQGSDYSDGSMFAGTLTKQ